MSMSIKSGIYKITNTLNGKIYIGSAVCFYKRKISHFDALRKNKHHSILLQRSFNKYGESNFTFKILELVEDKTRLIPREQFYLDLLKPEYNICKVAGSTLGLKKTQESIKRQLETKKLKGNLNSNTLESARKQSILMKQRWQENKYTHLDQHRKLPHSEERRRKNSESKKGILKSEEHKRNLSIAKLKLKFRHSEETKRNISERNKKLGLKPPPQPKIKIVQLDLRTNLPIKIWDSSKEAAKDINRSSTTICLCLKGIQKSCGGFGWKYL